jgi:hypothetical protein
MRMKEGEEEGGRMGMRIGEDEKGEKGGWG